MLFSIQSSSKQVPQDSTGSLAEQPPPPSLSSSPHLSQKNDAATSPQKPRRVQYLPLIGQVLLAVFPALFIALAATSISLHRQHTSRVGEIAEKAIFISPTVFPIVFAAIVGKLLRAIALFWSERGIKLGTLERLVGSQSFFSAVERQVLLRGQYALGIFLILLWALSPLGGQAALRLLNTAPYIAHSNETIRYLPIAAMKKSGLAIGLGGDAPQLTWPAYASIYMTALITSNQYRNSSQDLFGNVRIPSLSALAPLANASWTAIDHSQDVPYSSLVGIPVVGIPATGNVTFELVSRYLAIECDKSYSKTDPYVFGNNRSNGKRTWNRGGSFFLESINMPNKPPVPEEIVVSFNFSSIKEELGVDLDVFECQLWPRDVESSVSCVGKSCEVTSMRRLSLDRNSWAIGDYLTITGLLEYMPLSTVGTGSWQGGVRRTSSMTEFWLADPYTNFDPVQFGVYANLSKLSLPRFSRNLEVALNTLWQAGYEYKYIFGNLSTDMRLYDDFIHDPSNPFPDQQIVLDFNTTHVVKSMEDGEEYRCNMTFASLLIVISAILLMCEVASIILRISTLAPDILGYVSSFTRDNPYAETDEASHSDGLDRTRALRDVQVMVGDVNPEGATGHITFTTMDSAQRLNKDRLYD